MSRILPILFNTEMVKAILDDYKTVTRRLIKYGHHDIYGYACLHGMWYEGASITPEMIEKYVRTRKMPYQPGDTLYIRETWAFATCITCNGEYRHKGSPVNCYDYQAVEYDDGDSISDGCFIYRADHPNSERITWHPSIHMPKAAARIWLKVKDVRVEQLQDITEADAKAEGAVRCHEVIRTGEPLPVIYEDEWGYYALGFKAIWNSTLKKADIDKYGWDANPWVWVIEFERCEKPESEV